MTDRLPPRGENVIGMVVSTDDYERLLPTAAAYHGRFAVELLRVEIAGTVPLRPGAVFDGGVYQLALRDIRYVGPQLVTFDGIETIATSTLDREPGQSYTVYARNRARSEAVQGYTSTIASVDQFAGFGVHVSFGLGPGYSRRAVTVGLPAQDQQHLEITLGDEWLKDAELVVVRTTTVGDVERTIDIPRVTVCTAPNGQC